MKKINAPKPKKIQFSKKKAALHKMLEALIKEDNDTAAAELHNYLQAKSREILGEESEEDEKEEKGEKEEDEKEEKEKEEKEDDEKDEVDESYNGPGFYGIETKTGTVHVKANSKEHAQEQAKSKVKNVKDIKKVFFDKAKTKQSDGGKKAAH